MKKILVIILVLTLFLSISGCGVKRKIENKVGEAIGEKVIEGATGQKVDIKGDEITIKGEDGSKATMGGGEWPKSELMKNIPEFKGGKIQSVFSTEDGVVIYLEDVEQDDFDNYLANIKRGFSKNTSEINSDDGIAYIGGNGEGINVQVSHSRKDKTSIITVAQEE
jgi:hypothetical protein